MSQIAFKPGLRLLSLPGDSRISRPLPPVKQQLKNLARDGVKVIRNAAKTGTILIDAATAEKNAEICAKCEFFRQSDERCSHPRCGCFSRVKVWFSAMQCPDNPPRWSNILRSHEATE